MFSHGLLEEVVKKLLTLRASRRPLLKTNVFFLSSDVGFKVGRNSGISHFVMQIHYGDISAFRGECGLNTSS